MNIIGIGMGIPFNTKTKCVLVRDGFNRADAAVLGNAETGQPWQVLKGNWGISNNRICVTDSNIVDSCAVIDAGVADCIVKAIFALNLGITRLVVRVSAQNNFFSLQYDGASYALYRFDGGATQLGSFPGTASGDQIEVILKGNSIKIRRNGIDKLSVTDSYNATITKHGFSLGGSPVNLSARWDDFIVEAI